MTNFSIILPTYNRAAFLPNAIKSVIHQTFEQWELIIIDDGSTDETEAIVNQFTTKDQRIKYIYQENAERSAARNTGILHANGQYICFLDSDDIYHPSHLQCFVGLISKYGEEPALYFSGVSLNQFDCNPFVYNEQHATAQEFVLLNSIGTPRACITKSLVEAELFNPHIRIGEDLELWMRIAAKAPVFYHYTSSFIEIDHSNRSVSGNSVYAHLETLKYILKEHNVTKRISKQLLSNSYFNITKYELGEGNRYKALSYIVKSLIIDLGNNQRKLKLNVLVKLLIGQDCIKISKIIE